MNEANPLSVNRIFITGATGFVGGHLKRHLMERGYDVFSATRSVVGDPFAADSWRRVIEKAECGTVVHLIAKTHSDDAADPSALPSYRRVNVDITDALLQASSQAGVRKFLYLSSIKAVGEETPMDEPFTEKSPCRPEDCYGITKREAEERVLRYAESMNTIILRPPLIYGPGVKGNFRRLLNAVRKGVPLPFAEVRNARSLLFSGNLVHSVERALLSERAEGVYHIADDEAPSTPELLRLIASAMAKSPRLFSLPPKVLLYTGKLAGKGGEVRKLISSLLLSTERAKKELAYEPLHTLSAAVRSLLAQESDGEIRK